jgi:hypothetical protein
MRRRVAAIVVLAGAMLFALSIGRANARSDKESCTSTTTDQMSTNVDGTECQTFVSGAGPNMATAKASGVSAAEASAANEATVSANASNQSLAVCDVADGSGSATSSGVGADADVDITPSGSGTAKAAGAHSMAESTISSVNGGEADTIARNGSTADAVVEMTGGGQATATASGRAAVAESVVDADCTAQTNARGLDSTAIAHCQNTNSSVTAEATNGSYASGSDTDAPVCDPRPGGKARVRSPMGNCG